MIMVCQAKIVHLVPGITNWFGKWKFIYRIQKIIPIFTKSNGKKTTAQSFAPYFSTIGVLLARQTKQFVWRVRNNESSLCVCRLNKTYWRIVFQDCFTYETHNKWRNRTYVCSAAINEKAIKKKNWRWMQTVLWARNGARARIQQQSAQMMNASLVCCRGGRK